MPTIKRATPEGDGRNSYKLFPEIIALSNADNWEDANREWNLDRVFFADPDEPGTCLCGHTPILRQCVMVNSENDNVAIVGSVCVTRFLGMDSEQLFDAFQRIAEDPERALSAAAVEHAWHKGWINDRERSFYTDTLRIRRLSGKQIAFRVDINVKVLRRLSWGRRPRQPS